MTKVQKLIRYYSLAKLWKMQNFVLVTDESIPFWKTLNQMNCIATTSVLEGFKGLNLAKITKKLIGFAPPVLICPKHLL